MGIQIEYSAMLPYFAKIRYRAEKLNDAKAQFELAGLCSKGKSPESAAKAFNMYKKAAKQRYTDIQTDAMFAVGKCYEHGRGIRKSYQSAIRWYEAAENNIVYDLRNNPDPVGDAGAALIRFLSQTGLLDEILEAPSYEKSAENSFERIKAAAECGDAEAQDHLGRIYLYGHYGKTEIPKNRELAVYWSVKAAGQGCEGAMSRLAEYYKSEGNYREAAKWHCRYAEAKIKWRNERLGWL